MPKQARKRTVVPAVLAKAPIAKAIAAIIKDRGWTQTETGYATGEAPSQISLMVSGKLHGFSAERLLRMLTALGCDIEVRMAKAKRGTGKVRLSVK